MEWGINTLISPEYSVGLIALGPTGPGIGVANTDMPWATWEAEFFRLNHFESGMCLRTWLLPTV